jgi:hypothetical protein
MEKTLYVRNNRPNAVLIRYAGQALSMDRRGSRNDTGALPADAEGDPTVAAFITRGIIEIITKEQFFALDARDESERGLPVKQRPALEVNIPMNDANASREPYIITQKDLDANKGARSPQPTFAGPVPTTDEDIARIVEAAKAVTEASATPVSETDELRAKVDALTALVTQLVESQKPVKKAAPRQRQTSTAAKKSA